MLFSLGHGQHVIDTGAAEPPIAAASAGAGDTDLMVVTADEAGRADVVPLTAVVEVATLQAAGNATLGIAAAAPGGGAFAYYFPDADPLPEASDMADRLDALAEAMIEQNPVAPAQNLSVPPIFTYLGQFIDHDITANTDRESDISRIDGDAAPVARSSVQEELFNLRDGSLRLDSVYGDTLIQGPFARKLSGLMRHPTIAGKMRLGTTLAVPGEATPLPADPAADLLRLGFLLDKGLVTQAELEALPEELKAAFFKDGAPRLTRAIIGDGRNDENLLVAQLHMTLLRFHNKLVDATGSFDEARRLMRWHYQWLVVNEYCTTICDPDIVRDVVAREAPLYAGFLVANPPAAAAQLPLPLEFSVAAFRFGHSMIRNGYDHNRFFGEAVPGIPNRKPFAGFDDLFGFTGNGDMLGLAPKLPSNWVIEWERFVKLDPARPNRTARAIDTFIAPTLGEMVNEGAGVFKHLAKRNLRRGYRLSLPTGEACVAALQAGRYPVLVAPLAHHELASGTAGDALNTAGLADGATPLWYYILKEAEVRAQGKHLGPLGSVLVADTLVGLVVNDPDSYWRGGAGVARWAPADAALPGGPVDSFEKLLRFAGML